MVGTESSQESSSYDARAAHGITGERKKEVLVRGKKKYRFTIFFKQDKGRFHGFASLRGLVSG